MNDECYTLVSLKLKLNLVNLAHWKQNPKN